jgi:hypothetical protein
MGEHRNDIGAALIGVGGACWVGAIVADGSNAMGWLSVPSIVLFIAGAACLLAAVWAFSGPPHRGEGTVAGHHELAPALSASDGRDLALSLQGELEEASDAIGRARGRGQWWFQSEAPPATVWAQREPELRTHGEHFHKPVRDAYRKVEQHNRDARLRQEAEYEFVGREHPGPTMEVSAADNDDLVRTTGVIKHALDRLSELASERRDSETPAVVTDEHRDALRTALDRAERAIVAQRPRDQSDPLLREMFVAHFPDLDGRLVEWDRRAEQTQAAPWALRDALDQQLAQRGLDQPPYNRPGILEGFAAIIGMRSIAGTLGEALPPVIGTPAALLLAFASDAHHTGYVEFNPSTSGTNARVISWEGSEYPRGQFNARAEALIPPLHELLTEAQGWPGAAAIRSTLDAREAFPVDDVLAAIRRELVRPRFAVVAGCPGCE